jgi:hypothetical protein
MVSKAIFYCSCHWILQLLGWCFIHSFDRAAISAHKNFSELLFILPFACKPVTTGRSIWSKYKRNLKGGSSRLQVIAMTKIFICIVVWDTRVPIGYLYANCWLCILRLWCNFADLDMKLISHHISCFSVSYLLFYKTELVNLIQGFEASFISMALNSTTLRHDGQ